MFLEFGSPNCANASNWWSIDIVRRLVTGEIVDESLLDSEKVEFVKAYLEEIEDLFSMERVKQSEKLMGKYQAERAKRWTQSLGQGF